MNKILISAFATCLAAAAPTTLWAQDTHHDQGQPSGGQPQGGQHGNPGGDQSSQHATPSGAPTGGAQGEPRQLRTMQGPGATSHTTTTQTTPRYHRTTTGTTGATTGSRYRRTTTGAAVYPRPMERSHVRVDIQTYHRNVTAERRFHYGEYRAPRGYEYRRWSYGERLPTVYFGRDYWIPNYINFGLPWAPDGYVWVRFGSDAILIDEYTGEIVQVVYDVFY